MFFWKDKRFFKHINSFKASLQSCHKKSNPNKSDIRNNPIRMNLRITKRTFFFTSSYYQASMCLEATLSLSFFLLFFVNVFSIIFIYMTYTKDLNILHQQGKKIAAYGYITEELLQSKEDNIFLQKTRSVEAPMSFFAGWKCQIYTQCVIKPWNGYDLGKVRDRNVEEEMVYVTEYGSVYHKNRSCSYLVLSIRGISFSKLHEEKNELGEKYESCEYCKDKEFVTLVYVTSYGNKYHTTTKCQGIKRSIKNVPLSEVEEKKLCNKCG